jgi:hypothetical protein
MARKIMTFTLLLLCGVVLFIGCPMAGEDGKDGLNGVDGAPGKNGEDGKDAIDSPLKLTLIGAYGVAHPNAGASQTNYIVLDVEAGDYTKGIYTLNEVAVTPTPVLTANGRTTVVKIAAPVGGGGLSLAVKEDEKSVLDESVTVSAAGVAAPTTVLYGEKFMTFSEFFHDVTADIADIRPLSTSFAATGYVAKPKQFINAGTRTGNNSAGAANGTPKWTDTDALPKVDVISSATYGDSAHFVPTVNLAMNYPDSMTKADWHEVTGVKAVEVGVDFDLFANADILRQIDKTVATSAAVLAKVDDISWKASTEVYKAKYLRPDASWGKRDETAINEGKAAVWPKAIGGNGGATAGVSYGGTWADKVIAVDFAPLPAGLDSAGIWNNYFDRVYAGYVEDLQTGHKEPLVWLQNLFSHRGHTNLEAAIQRAGFSRMSSLSPSGNFKLVILAHGLKDIVVESVAVSAYDGQSSAAIEQGSTFYVSGTGAAADFQNSAGVTIAKELHVTGLSADALADFDANSGKLLKGTAEIPTTACELNYEEADGEIAITLKDAFFTGAFQGSYSLSITPSAGKVYSTVPFTVNRIIARPKLQQGAGTASDADSATTAIEVTTGGGNITFDNEDFAKAILVSGRSVSTIEPAVTGGITAVLKRASADAAYDIDASVLTSGTAYTLTILTANFVNTARETLATATYYIKAQ